jgi:hypothetical protein
MPAEEVATRLGWALQQEEALQTEEQGFETDELSEEGDPT